MLTVPGKTMAGLYYFTGVITDFVLFNRACTVIKLRIV